LDPKIQCTSNFLLDFFKKFLEEDCKCGEIKIRKNERIKISPFKDSFPKNVVPLGFLVTNHKPNPNKFCDLESCSINNSNYKVLNCGHSFHEICLNAMGSSCVYCMEFYIKKINEITLSFNYGLNSDVDVNGDIGDDDDDNENIEEDDDDNEDINNDYTFNNNQMINELKILANRSPSNNNNNDSPIIKKRKNSNRSINQNKTKKHKM